MEAGRTMIEAFDSIPAVTVAALRGAAVGGGLVLASAMAFAESAGPQADLTVVADRAFLWAIVHPDTGVLLFIGRLVDPTP